MNGTDVMLRRPRFDRDTVRRRRMLEDRLCCRIGADGWCEVHHRGEDRCVKLLGERRELRFPAWIREASGSG